MQSISTKKIILFFSSIASLAGLILVFLVTFQSNQNLRNDVLFSNMLSYFTVQSNILVFVFSFLLLLDVKIKSRTAKLFYFGTTVNIVVTGITYIVVLAGVWEPKGWALVGDALLHYVSPFLFLLHWCLYSKNLDINIKTAALWFIYPVLYLVYTLLRGLTVDFYPYPFIDARELSYQQILLNSVGVAILFVFVGITLFSINRLKSK